jgi:hypothetical protein
MLMILRKKRIDEVSLRIVRVERNVLMQIMTLEEFFTKKPSFSKQKKILPLIESAALPQIISHANR